MPVNGSSASSSNAPGGANRTTFRPPWVKDGPQPIPMPAQGQAWRRDSTKVTPSTENGQPKEVTTKLQSREIKVPVMTEKAKPALTPIKPKDKEIKAAVVEKAENDEGMPKNRFVRPVLRKTQKVDEIKETEKGKATVRDRDQEPVNPWKKDAVQKKIPPPVVKPLPPPVKVEEEEEEVEEEEESSYEEVTDYSETESEEEPEKPAPKPKVEVKAAVQKPEVKKLEPILKKPELKKVEPVKKPEPEPKKVDLKNIVLKKVDPKVEEKSTKIEPEYKKVNELKNVDLKQKTLKLIAQNSINIEPEIEIELKKKSVLKSVELKKVEPKKIEKPINKSVVEIKELKNADKKSNKEFIVNNKNVELKKVEPKKSNKSDEQDPKIKNVELKKIDKISNKSVPEAIVSGKKSNKSAEKIVENNTVELKNVDPNLLTNKSAAVKVNELDTFKLKKVDLKKLDARDETKSNTKAEAESSLKKTTKDDDSSKKVTAPPAPGPPPPPPPPMSTGSIPPPPPPMGAAAPKDFERKPMSEKHKAYLEKLKNRTRKRPDWSEMMKEVEGAGGKLKHVKCNDRSNPILKSNTVTKIEGQFIFETEKGNKLNELLNQISSGVKLRPTKTNDRSKPILQGLRKFRRQMTIEEQIQKSESRHVLNEELNVADEESGDEMDDIDKLRDDLQSTKQLLSIELRNKEAQERESKRLLSRIQNLEAELEIERNKVKTEDPNAEEEWPPSMPSTTPDEQLVKTLKDEAAEAQKTSKLLEKKFQDTAEQLDNAKSEIEEQRKLVASLEKKLANQQEPILQSERKWSYAFEEDTESDDFWADNGLGPADNSRRASEAQQRDSSPELEPEVSESEDDEDEDKKAERKERRLVREVKMLSTKLTRLKSKRKTAQTERESLRSAMKKNQQLLKEEKKKFKKLQREVDKMAAMMNVDEDDEDGEEKEEKEEPEEEEDPPETESEESESESESEAEAGSDSESEDEDATSDKKKDNLEPRVKRYEGRLAALKKGNYLLQANVDRIQDEINKTRETSVTLQRDLDSVLSELG